ncbi:ArsC family reductase [Tsuneonella flava]|uniref:ArsC family reductase n=1 Tax=Tsuneonella flava TaxID=2055955 RepID=A0ABX7KER9_9SPHN|nr:ArsC family reductase [Tsuneonella flava]QSB45751.1 ArsC family reductase [Tsuneonella flava]
MTIAFYGIPNCDTVKKARKWLDDAGIAYTFHDYKKEGADPALLRAWIADAGWEALLNRRGTTFRKLEPEQKEGIDAEKAVRLMEAQPSMIKRPVVVSPDGILIGFDADRWAEVLG